jgi:hypothetical protein
VLYLAIPAHNEVATIGVLLWRIRTVLAEFPREYEVVVYDDASTDETATVASQYEQAMPVTVLRGQTHLGYAGAVDALLRHVAQQTRYPRRDAVLLLQGDFTDPPGIVPEFARRFEGGADLVVGERLVVADAPLAVRRLFKGAHWAMRPFVRVDGVKDITASMRLVRISALRDALRAVGDQPLVTGDTWTANADLLLRLAPHARRVESVPMEPTYGVRMRETRRVAMRDALSALKWAWGARGRRASVGSSAEAAPESDRRPGRGQGGKRREEQPELSVDRLREKVRERDGTRGLDGEPEKPRDKRRGRDRERPERAERETPRTERTERPERTERAPRTDAPAERAAKPRRERPERAERPEREERPAAENRPPKPVRAEKPERPERPPRARREDVRATAASTLDLDDPFAPPAPKLDPLSKALALPSAPGAPDADTVRHDTHHDAPLSAPGEPRSDETSSESASRPPRRERAESDNDALSAPASTEGADDSDDDDENDSAEGAEGEGEGAEGEVRRKRRRNRRSRRGRRRREGGDSNEAGESGNPENEATPAEGDSADAPDAAAGATREPIAMAGQPVRRRPPADEGDGEGDDGDADTESDADGDAGAAADGESPRARRRGRRGRRGGARRSRGRRERGEGGADESAGDAPAPDGDE